MKTNTKKVLSESPDVYVLDFEAAKVFATSTEINDASVNNSLTGLEWED